MSQLIQNVEDEVLPDGVLGAVAVNPAVLVQDDVSLQVPVVVMGRVEVGDDAGRDAQAAQDWDTERQK